MVESNICTRCAVSLIAASVSNKRLEDTRLAQSPEPFTHAIPVVELGGKRLPCYVVDREGVKC